MRSAYEIAEGVRNGTLSPTDVLEETFARIDALEPEIEAWVECDRGAALRRADELEDARRQGEPLGPLAGVPVGVKDIVDVLGFTTRAGAAAFAHYAPQNDACVAKRLRQAGAIILGKTHTTEFAYLDPAPTKNPWNRAHTPGGSSSGSAASVGAGMLPLAIGSQTVGSVLRPAAYCGIVGLKPSFGRISYAGVLPLAQSFDHLGVLVTRVRDAALALGAIAGYDPADPGAVDAPVEDYVAALGTRTAPRLGVPRNYFEDVIEPENREQLEAAVERLRSAGAEVVEVTFPAAAQAIADATQPLMRYEAAKAHAERYAANRDAYRTNIKTLVEAGMATSDAAYATAKAYVADLRASLSAILEDVDAILMPTAPGTAPGSLESTGPGIFCGPASFTGLPSISLPSGVSPAGLPFSVQLIGPHLGESKLLSAAAWVESVVGFDAKPDLPA